MRHCFPRFWQAVDGLEDPRDPDRITYSLKHVICLVTLLFACRVPSRRQLDRFSDDATFRDNLARLCGQPCDTVMCSAQMINVLKALDAGELAGLQPELLRQLIASKRLKDAYVLGHLALASDGTGIFSSSEPHCSQCLTQRHADGTVTYMHNVLEAKVLCADGMAISALSEPVQNNAEGKYDKQDCETKAFKRLLPRIKEAFPRQPLVHLLDSLYANGPALDSIGKAKHAYICNFKRGSIPTLYDESLELARLGSENVLRQQTHLPGAKNTPVRQVITWVNGLHYQGLTLAFVQCEETNLKNDTRKAYAWLTSFEVTRDNVREITRGGRMRWKIENEGFREQKFSYDVEHFCDCKDPDAMRALYLLLQTAHMFMQLLAKSNLLQRPVQALRHLAFLLLESLRNTTLDEFIPTMNLPPMQVRFAKGDP